MTVNDLYMTIVNLYYYSDVTAYDKHSNKILPDVEYWGDLVEYYPESEVLFFNYLSNEITLRKIRR